MKNRWGWLPLAACMLAFVTAPAAGQLGNIRLFPDGYWNVGSKDKVDATGSQYVTEAFPSYDNWQYQTVFGDTISNASNGNQSDSTEVFQTHFARSAVLMVHPITHGAAGSVLRIAVSIRLSAIGVADSSSHFMWSPWAGGTTSGFARGGGVTPVRADSIGHIGAVGTDNTLGTREFVMVLKPDVDLASAATNDGPEQPKGFVIPLGDLWAPYMSLKFRVLNDKTSVTANYMRTRLYITYAGGSR